jgi:4-amino-4-deoxy-L-arabinose transferase-like glycosyltransferase
MCRSLFLDVMDVDASQYASISMEMLQSGSWLEVLHRRGDYLDKPPLLFWLSACSFSLFGLSNFAYKLPSLLIALLGVYAVYRFARQFYGGKTSRQAAFILASSLGFTVICNDVRTDTLLLGFTACAVWLLAEYLQNGRWYHVTGAFICIALAMMAKGPIGLVLPGLAVGSHLLWQRNWSAFFRWEWLVGLLLVAVLLFPMCWGLYHQYDLHPEKSVNGRTGVSGLYFFFWEQSFGRITGENVWKNDTTVFYFLHVYAWAFAPWMLWLSGALIQQARSGGHKIIGKITDRAGLPEYYALGAFALTFIALSLSRYKLPHYIFITLPWASVLTAHFVRAMRNRIWFYLQYLIYGLVSVAVLLLLGWVFCCKNPLIWGVVLCLLILLWRGIFRHPFPDDSDTNVQRGVLAALLATFVLNFHFYPTLLPYQSTSHLMKQARAMDIPPTRMAFFIRHGHALDFYNGALMKQLDTPEQVRGTAREWGDFWLYTDEQGRKILDENGITYTVTAQTRHFQVALLKPAFLNPKTREQTLEEAFLLNIKAEQPL